MSTTLKRTSMALDLETIDALDYLADMWNTSKADVIRRCVKSRKKQEEETLPEMTPREALEWLRNNPISKEQAKEAYKRVEEMRNSWRDPWER